jgi:hypothetical protein
VILAAVMMRCVLDAIAAAVDAATRDGHGQVLLLRGRLDVALGDFGHHLGDLLEGGFDVAGARGDFVAADGVRHADPEALTAAVEALLDGGRTVVLGLADVDRAFPPLRWHDVFLKHTLPALAGERRLVVVASTSVDGVLPATTLATGTDEPDPDAANAPLRQAFYHLSEETAAKGFDLAVRTLRVGALEGEVFTHAAVARLLEEDEDQLTDWVDDYLATDDGPLEDIGFTAGLEGPLARYRFRDRAVWAALQADPPGRRVVRRYGEVLAALYGPTAPEVAFRVWVLSGAEHPNDYLEAANAAATVGDHVRVLAVESDPDVRLRSLDRVAVMAAHEQWFGDVARCEALALELVDDAFPVVQRCVGLAGALLDLARRETGGEPHLGLALPWLDAIVDDRDELIAAAARVLERAGTAIEQVATGDREHWRAHLQHAHAQLEAARGDWEAARAGEERTIALLGEEPLESCNVRGLTLLGLADAREALADAAGARDAARQGVLLSVARSELAEAARGLAKAGRMELALGDARAAAQTLAYSLVIALELELRWAEPGLWAQLARCLDGAAAQACLAVAGAGDDERALTFLKDVTGVDRAATEAFLNQLGRTTPPAAPAA